MKQFAITFFLILANNILFAQHKFVVSAGPGYSNLFDVKTDVDNYSSNYNGKLGFDFRISYELKIDTLLFETGINYRIKRFYIFAKASEGRTSVTKSLDYIIHQASLSFLQKNIITDNKNFKCVFLIGPQVSFLLEGQSQGVGQYYDYSYIIDSLNFPTPTLVKKGILKDYISNKSDKNYLNKFYIELAAGIELDFKVYNNLDLLLLGFCDVSLTPAFKIYDNYTSAITGNLLAGCRFNLK